MIVYVADGGAGRVGRRLDRPGGGPARDGAVDRTSAPRRRSRPAAATSRPTSGARWSTTAATSLRALAEEHGRNGDWAEQAVRVASNLTAREALDRNVIDEIAPTLPALLNKIDGSETDAEGLVLHTADAERPRSRCRSGSASSTRSIDPNIIVLLMSLGDARDHVELYNPGLVLPGTIGAHVADPRALRAAGAADQLGRDRAHAARVRLLRRPRLRRAAHGALTVSGIIAFVLGALMLFDPAGPLYDVSVWVALAIAGTIAAAHGLRADEGRPGAPPAGRGRSELARRHDRDDARTAAWCSRTASSGRRAPSDDRSSSRASPSRSSAVDEASRSRFEPVRQPVGSP